MKTAVLYTPEWLKAQEYVREWGERALLAVFAHLGLPGTMLDLGCGDGYLVKLAASLGVRSMGADVALAAPSKGDGWYLKPTDLRRPATFSGPFDLVISWETGEHLPIGDADTYLDTVVEHAGEHLVFTAAPPGQDGEGHVNCQPPEWWTERLGSRGLSYEEELTEQLRETWKWATGPCFWLPQNVQVFSR